LKAINQFRKVLDIMEKLTRDRQPSRRSRKPMNEKIQEKVMDGLSGMVMCWSSHIAGQKSQADAVQEIRKTTTSILEWLDDLENEFREAQK